MSDEITIVVPINAKPEYREEVENTLRELARLTNLEAGNVCYVLHQAQDNPDQFIIYEKWQNQNALDFHMNQEYLKSFLAQSDRLLSEDIKGTICHEI